MNEIEQLLVDGEDLQRTFGNQLWRLNNLYPILTKDDGVQIFNMSPMQRDMYENRWWRNIILKVRQIGSSTLWCIFILDSCLFSKHPIRAGIIAQTRPKAKQLLEKCAFAFDRMDPVVKEAFGLIMKGGGERRTFADASFIASGITMRSETIDLLLVSEMGKLAAKYPEKASEVITGTLPTLPDSGMVVIESTAEGHDGYFFDMVETAGDIQENPSRALGQKDMHLHFFPWWDRPEYADDDEYELTDEHNIYFDKLRMRGILLTRSQKNWWARNKDLFKEKMASEYPSYREEAFQVGGRGLYLARSLIEAEEAGNVGSIAHDPNLPCVTAWDLGNNAAIWIYQYKSPVDRMYLDYIEGKSGDFDYWADQLRDLAAKKGYRYGAHIFPWDGEKMQGMKDTYIGFAKDAGLENIVSIEPMPRDIQVRHANVMMPRSFFDLEGTMLGRKRIKGYRRKFDNAAGEFSEDPVKNVASHGAEAFIVSTLYAPANLYMPSDGNGAGEDTRGLFQKMLGLSSKGTAKAARTDHSASSRSILKMVFGGQ